MTSHSSSRLGGLAALIPGRQFSRYLLVGVGNTVFGYSSFAILTAIFDRTMPHGYMVAAAISNIVSITVAFLAYKWFVFRTKGNYLREWLRCVGVYSGSAALNLLLLPVLVVTIRNSFGYHKAAPYIAGGLLTAATVLLSFFGHRNFSFRASQS